jgi:hypothetical protein
LVVELEGRPQGNLQEPLQLRIRVSTTSFCYVGWYRNGRTAKLTSESPVLRSWKSLGESIDAKCELVGSLPHLELDEISHVVQSAAAAMLKLYR